MSWLFVLSLSATAYLFKFLGLVVVGDRHLPDVVTRCLALIPAALVAAIIVQNTVADGHSLVLDERAAGVAAAVLAAWRKLPLIVVIVIGAAVTALLRAVQ